MDRLHKILSHAGIASRRAAERLIQEGRVTVNGVVIRELGTKADPTSDDIRVDSRRIKTDPRRRYILLNKPRGYVTTRSDPQRRRTVMDLIQAVHAYVYAVGRLDYDTEGLILLTNDGELAAALMHPRHGIERTYEARVVGTPSDEALERLRRGVPLDGHRTMPATVDLLGARRDGHAVLRVTVREGRNRQVRRMCEAVGHPVERLARIRIGPVSDPRLPLGHWRELTAQEVRALQRQAASAGTPRVPRSESARRPAPTPPPPGRPPRAGASRR